MFTTLEGTRCFIVYSLMILLLSVSFLQYIQLRLQNIEKCNHHHLPMIWLSIGFYLGLSRKKKLKHSPFCHCHSVKRAKLESKMKVMLYCKDLS